MSSYPFLCCKGVMGSCKPEFLWSGRFVVRFSTGEMFVVPGSLVHDALFHSEGLPLVFLSVVKAKKIKSVRWASETGFVQGVQIGMPHDRSLYTHDYDAKVLEVLGARFRSAYDRYFAFRFKNVRKKKR